MLAMKVPSKIVLPSEPLRATGKLANERPLSMMYLFDVVLEVAFASELYKGHA